MILEKRGFLFDLDGTLIDTTSMIIVCFQKVMQHFYGHNLEPQEIKRYIGLPYRTQLEKYTGKLTEEQFEEIVSFHREHQRQIAHSYITLCKGTMELLSYLEKQNKVMGIVTSRLIDSTADYLQFLKIDRFFQTIITPAETEYHKPHPQPLLKAMEVLSLSSQESVYIGDSLFDMQAAKAANLTSIYTAWNNEDFPFEGLQPNFIVSDLKEILFL